ncbi:Uncharacterized membrane protein [Alteromonadaceae bacterium Bs31]|nr:Uncharacterized membrane protein [Alteromonadaceae bacterium Bs31]
MSNYRKWLLNEVELWCNQGLISSEQARQIAALYPYNAETNWGKIIFAGVGAVIFGLGIILVLAYNWEFMHRLLKLAVVLSSVAIAHGIGFYYSRSASPHQRIGESLHLLGTMLFGAGIWLVAQVYHIDEHYPNAFFIWAMGAMVLAWVLPSISHTLLALLLVFLWHWYEVFDFHGLNQSAIWLVLVGILPIAWTMRARGPLFLACCLIIFSYSTTYFLIAEDNEQTLVGVIMSLSATMVVGSHIAGQSLFPQSENIFRLVGVAVFAVLLFIYSFSEFDAPYFSVPLSGISASTWGYYSLPTLLLSVALILVFTRYPNTLTDKLDKLEIVLVSGASYLAFFSAFSVFGLYGIVWVLFSVLYLVYSILLIYRGARLQRWQSTTLGGLMLSAYTFARFIDLFESLLLRGLAFLVVGAMLFAIGIYYSKQKQIAEQQGGDYEHQ